MSGASKGVATKESRRPGRGLIVTAVVAAVAVALGAGWLARGYTRTASLARSARAAVSARRFDEARRLIDRWVARSPRDGEAFYLRAKTELASDHPQPALDAL